ncbi:MAG: aspartate 1-decarboxylase [Solirubrobacterales bacterium]
MQRQMLKSKIHRATITACDVDYVGSVSIDPELMRQADLMANEQVHIWDIANGARMVTYAIEGDSNQIKVNGAAARLVNQGDLVIIVSYALYSAEDLDSYAPVVVHVDEANEMVQVDSSPEVLLNASGRAWTDEVPGSLG